MPTLKVGWNEEKNSVDGADLMLKPSMSREINNNMKRRTVDGPKLRRTLKKGRITESMNNGSLIYLKLLMAWALLMMADFLLGFRFEYLWPFWLLVRSIYDSFRYQGVAFSVFFVCITVTSDLVCFLFIPVQWLFFLASTYVWVQYVWHADRGVCLPTVALWLLFIYVEASVRLKELTNSKAFPFTLDLCRPFAAHCIGYPVVTLGFGVKTYVGYKFRLRKQREVAKENEFYAQLLAEALPSHWDGANPDADVRQRYSSDQVSGVVSGEEISENGAAVGPPGAGINKLWSPSSLWNSSYTQATPKLSTNSAERQRYNFSAGFNSASDGSLMMVNGKGHDSSSSWLNSSDLTSDSASSLTLSKSHPLSWFARFKWRILGIVPPQGSPPSESSVMDDSDYEDDRESLDPVKESGSSNKRGGGQKGTKRVKSRRSTPSQGGGHSGDSFHQFTHQQYTKESLLNVQNEQKQCAMYGKVQDKDVMLSLESDMEKLKNDLRSSRSVEQDLRHQLQQLSTSDKSAKNEMQHVRQKNEQLETKLHNLVRAREQDKQTIQTLEKKLVEENNRKNQLEKDIKDMEKMKKAEEAAALKALASAGTIKMECSELCKSRRREMETEMKQLRRDYKIRDDAAIQLEMEVQLLRPLREKNANAEVLMSALGTMKEKNVHLEKSLSAESRLKVDLYSALGEAKRQLGVVQSELEKRTRELDELRRKLGQTEPGSGSGSSTVTPPPLSLGGAPTLTGEIGSMEQTNMYNLIMAAAAAYPQGGGMLGNGDVGESMGTNGMDYLNPNGQTGVDSSFMGNGQLSFTPPHSSN